MRGKQFAKLADCFVTEKTGKPEERSIAIVTRAEALGDEIARFASEWRKPNSPRYTHRRSANYRQVTINHPARTISCPV